MVAKIVIGKSIRGILHYNENKVAEGEAILILASGFAGDTERMSFNNKLQRFENLTSLKPSVKTNALHITLNFDSSEKIDNAKMQQIAIAYMERIGFGDQPFLVYRHNDVAHQHLHIATISILRNGIPIDVHNIGRDISEPARKAIEKEFDLVVAESRKFKPEPGIKPVDPEKIKYGHIPTKRAISNIVTAVMNTYKFTSLAEYNVVLKQFNVISDRGKEENEMFQKKGLIYFLLDTQGNKTVFNGSDLGKAYSAKALNNHFGNTDHPKTYLKQVQPQITYIKTDIDQPSKTYLEPILLTNYLKDLLGKSQPDFTPMIPRKKKKRKKGQGFFL